MKNINKLLDSVELSGYKTIKDVKVDLEEGINILIGKNSAGKSNFLDLLYYNLSFNFFKLNNFNSVIHYSEGLKISLSKSTSINSSLENNLHVDKDMFNDEFHYTIFDKNNIEIDKSEYSSINNFFYKNKCTYELVKICHGLPNNKYFIANDLSITLTNSSLGDTFFNNLRDDSIPSFTKNVMLAIANWFFMKQLEFEQDQISETDDIKKDVKNQFKDKLNGLFIDLNINLEGMTSIKEVRINNSFDLSIDSDKCSVRNLRLEYLVDGEWLDFDSLSDGTKRIFYIISETISFIDDDQALLFSPVALMNTSSEKYIKKIVLIEEPELGIHPHQLHKLLLFLKEESETKQILITTHSPLALNILNIESLNKVLVFNKENKQTLVKKISESEKQKIQNFVAESNLYLSDYWMFTHNDF